MAWSQRQKLHNFSGPAEFHPALPSSGRMAEGVGRRGWRLAADESHPKMVTELVTLTIGQSYE